MIPSFDNRSGLGKGTLHLGLRLGGKRIAYAYIRKNACSAFKVACGFPDSSPIDEVAAANPWERPWWHWYHATIFVWRDPEDRLVSLYKNKILDRNGADDIVARYVSAMNEEPSTFEKFAVFATLGADPHCLPQYDHLKPIRYSHAIPLARLHEAMVEIVGPNAAEPFARIRNASAPQDIEVTDAARAVIRDFYARDYEMITRLSRSVRE